MSTEQEHDLKDPLDKLCSLAADCWVENKWTFLYNYSRKSLDYEVERFRRIDEKSVKLLSSVSIIITIFVALFKWVFENQTIDFTVYVFVVAAAMFGALCLSWYFYFSALKLVLTPKMPLNDNVSLFKSCKNAVEESILIIEKKATKLKYGYLATSVSGVLLIIFVCMISYETIAYNNRIPHEPHLTKEVVSMPEKETKPLASNEPDLDIEAQDLQYSTEGLDETNIVTKKEKLNETKKD